MPARHLIYQHAGHADFVMNWYPLNHFAGAAAGAGRGAGRGAGDHGSSSSSSSGLARGAAADVSPGPEATSGPALRPVLSSDTRAGPAKLPDFAQDLLKLVHGLGDASVLGHSTAGAALAGMAAAGVAQASRL